VSQAGKTAYIGDEQLERLLDRLAEEGRVFIPRQALDRSGASVYSYKPRKEGQAFEYYGYRPKQPLKDFLFAGRQKVAEYPGKPDMPVDVSDEPVVVVGAAACDIASLESLDAVFLQDEYTDVFYKARRENTLIVTIDCTEPRETCFCTLAGKKPFPEGGFDLNLSRVEGGYLVEAASGRGGEIMNGSAGLFSEAGEDMKRQRDDSRAETERKVRGINRDFTLSKSRRELLEIQRESDQWYEHVETCVECGACLFGCPTCHCFILFDQQGDGGIFERIRKWDVCVYGGFSRMSGGSSPRLGLMQRFRHRYLHKFEYYPKNFGIEACTGCGRCIAGCMGKIDMRKVFKALESIPAEAR